MKGTKKLALVASAALAVSLVAVGSAGTAGAAAAHAKTTAGLRAHLPSNALHAAASTSPGTRAITHTAVNSNMGAGEVAGAELLSAGVTFRMPNFTCASSSDNEWLLPGIWIYDSSGNLSSQVDVNFNCNLGSKTQVDVICINGGSCDQSLSVNPGDLIEAVYVQDSAAGYGTIYDKTQGTVAQTSGSPQSGGSTILVGDQSGALFGANSVPTFTKISFSTATLNGYYLGDWFPQQTNMKNGRHVQVKASIVKTTSFSTTFVANL